MAQVWIRGFRSARDATFAPGSVCALVGEANAGKSNLLAALRALLDPDAPPLGGDDLSVGGDGRVTVRGLLASGETLLLEAAAPALLFLPAAARATNLVAASPAHDGAGSRLLEFFRSALAEQLEGREQSATAPVLAFVDALERCCACAACGLVLLIEEPELYLRPQAQRYLYRLLREFAAAGNQVIYSTHSPALLNVARLNELVFVERAARTGTGVVQPQPVAAEESFQVLTEFDAERSELFLARAAVLVEGMTEKLVLPFVFRALGSDPDREAISIVECGGKPNIPLVARICRAVGVPFLVVHDRDAPAGRQPIAAERALNTLIAETAGAEPTIVLEPDFEGVAGLSGHRRKPERAWQRFTSLPASELPPAARTRRRARSRPGAAAVTASARVATVALPAGRSNVAWLHAGRSGFFCCATSTGPQKIHRPTFSTRISTYNAEGVHA